MAGVGGCSRDLGCFAWNASDSSGRRSCSDQSGCRRGFDLHMHRPEPRSAFPRHAPAGGEYVSSQTIRVMMRAPTLDEIHAVELRVAQSRLNAWNCAGRARVAFRAVLARPSTLALTAGAAGLFGFWIARRPRPQKADTTFKSGGRDVKTSAASLVLGFLWRYGMQRLPFILQQIRAAREKRAAASGLSRRPAQDDYSGLRH